LVKGYKEGAKGAYITVRATEEFGDKAGNNIRIRVNSHHDYEISEVPVEPVQRETDDEIMERISERFEILEDMTDAAIMGNIRSMIVVGPPGVGKSYGVEQQLEKASLFDVIVNRPLKYDIVKGAISPIGLYAKLYKFSEPGNVLVFDDCDSVFNDELSLNILKAALDSGKKRRIHWNSDSHMLRREDIPDSYDFKASIIFITNLDFNNIKSKKLQDHLAALGSRCHYLDLTMNSMRDKFLRVKQIYKTGALFQGYNLEPEQEEEIIDFMDENRNKLNEMSIRMALKIADLTKVNAKKWRSIAKMTCMMGAA
jgi:hypothetical protein